MMGYFYLALAVTANAVKGFCGKKQSQLVEGVRGALTVNFLRMLCCAVVGAGILAMGGNFGFGGMSSTALPILLMSGIFNGLQVVLWLLAVQRSAFTLMDVFATLGLVLPMLVCSALFDEKIRPIQWAGFLVLCLAAVIMCSYSISLKKKKMSLIDLALLGGFGFSIGISDLSQKLYLNFCPGLTTNTFNFWTFLFAASFVGLLLLILPGKKEAPRCPLKKIWHYIVIMALALFAVTWCKTAAAAILPAVQVYPLFQGGVLVTMALMATLFFGEKITSRCVIGIGMTFAAMLMMNVL